MKLIKNKVGRPSNETVKKRKLLIVGIVALATVIVVSGGLFLIKSFKPLKGDVNGNKKYATVVKCYMPYSVSNCSKEYNRSVYHIQNMLRELRYYSGRATGYFDNSTKNAVIKFQKAKRFKQTGEIGSDELALMSALDGYAWVRINYNKNGGSGTLLGTTNGKQVMLGTATPISTTKLTSSGKTHVGWIATTPGKNGVLYYYGCSTAKCTSPTRYTASQKKSLGSKFRAYVYSIGEWRTAYEFPGTDVTFTAYYCNGENTTYNKSTSTCSKPANSSTNPTKPSTPATPTSKTTKYTTTNSKGFNVLKYDIKALSKNIGSQDVSECHYYSIAYGSYIILGKKPKMIRSAKPTVNARCSVYSACVYDSSQFGGCYVDSIYSKNCKKDVPSSLNYASEYKMIINKIDNGIPVVIHVKNNSGGQYNGEHWVLVVGYNSKVSSITSDTNGINLLNNVWIIDPYGDYGYNNTTNLLWEGIAIDRSKKSATSKSATVVKMYNTKYRTWDSRSKAK